MILQVYDDSLVFVVLPDDVISFEELSLEINDFFYFLMGWRSLDLSENLAEEKWKWSFLVGPESVFLKNWFKTDSAIGIQVSQLLYGKFFHGMTTLLFFPIVDFDSDE